MYSMDISERHPSLGSIHSSSSSSHRTKRVRRVLTEEDRRANAELKQMRASEKAQRQFEKEEVAARKQAARESAAAQEQSSREAAAAKRRAALEIQKEETRINANERARKRDAKNSAVTRKSACDAAGRYWLTIRHGDKKYHKCLTDDNINCRNSDWKVVEHDDYDKEGKPRLDERGRHIKLTALKCMGYNTHYATVPAAAFMGRLHEYFIQLNGGDRRLAPEQRKEIKKLYFKYKDKQRLAHRILQEKYGMPLLELDRSYSPTRSNDSFRRSPGTASPSAATPYSSTPPSPVP